MSVSEVARAWLDIKPDALAYSYLLKQDQITIFDFPTHPALLQTPPLNKYNHQII